jgi:hypothetical protein
MSFYLFPKDIFIFLENIFYFLQESILINVELLLDLTTYQLCLKPELLRKPMLTRGYLKEGAKPSLLTETNVSKCRFLGFRVFVSLVLSL